jgi:serine/threonine-protein kinase
MTITLNNGLELKPSEQINSGGQASIYKRGDTIYKVLHKSLDRYTDEAVARFTDEIDILLKLDALRYPHVPKIYDYSFKAQDSTYMYYSMEYIHGETLETHIRNGVVNKAHTIKALCQAIQYLHAHMIIHRDLKPSNIILDTNYQIYLIDFGISKYSLSSYHTTSDSIMGTMDYLPPEAFQAGYCPTYSTDFYQLGLIIYEILTGRLPFGGYNIGEMIEIKREGFPLIAGGKCDTSTFNRYSPLLAGLLDPNPALRKLNMEVIKNFIT